MHSEPKNCAVASADSVSIKEGRESEDDVPANLSHEVATKGIRTAKHTLGRASHSTERGKRVGDRTIDILTLDVSAMAPAVGGAASREGLQDH
jgi:hypothetical protein